MGVIEILKGSTCRERLTYKDFLEIALLLPISKLAQEIMNREV